MIAPVVQRIECRIPVPTVGVRFPTGVQIIREIVYMKKRTDGINIVPENDKPEIGMTKEDYANMKLRLNFVFSVFLLVFFLLCICYFVN